MTPQQQRDQNGEQAQHRDHQGDQGLEACFAPHQHRDQEEDPHHDQQRRDAVILEDLHKNLAAGVGGDDQGDAVALLHRAAVHGIDVVLRREGGAGVLPSLRLHDQILYTPLRALCDGVGKAGVGQQRRDGAALVFHIVSGQLRRITLLPQGEADAQKQQGSQKQHQQGRPASSQPAEYAFFGDGFFHTAPSFSGEIHLQLHHTA